MVLCIILLRSVLIPLRRLPTLYWRVFIIGEDTVPFIVSIEPRDNQLRDYVNFFSGEEPKFSNGSAMND